jgi:hypothetical protein
VRVYRGAWSPPHPDPLPQWGEGNESGVMTGTIVFLVDVDNTLLDNDRITAAREVTPGSCSSRCWCRANRVLPCPESPADVFLRVLHECLGATQGIPAVV